MFCLVFTHAAHPTHRASRLFSRAHHQPTQVWVSNPKTMARVAKPIREQLMKRLLVFRSGADRRITFSSALEPDQRKFVHVNATLLGLTSKSFGKGDDRTLQVFKNKRENERALARASWSHDLSRSFRCAGSSLVEAHHSCSSYPPRLFPPTPLPLPITHTVTGLSTVRCAACCELLLAELGLETASSLGLEHETRVAALLWRRSSTLLNVVRARMLPAGESAIAADAMLVHAKMHIALPLLGIDPSDEETVCVVLGGEESAEAAATLGVVRDAVAAAKSLLNATRAVPTPAPMCCARTRMLAEAHCMLGDVLAARSAAADAASRAGDGARVTLSADGGAVTDDAGGEAVAAWLAKTGAELKPVMAVSGDAMDCLEQAHVSYSSASALLVGAPDLAAAPLAAMARVSDAVRRQQIATAAGDVVRATVVWATAPAPAEATAEETVAEDAASEDAEAPTAAAVTTLNAAASLSHDALCLSLFRAARHGRADVAARAALDLSVSAGEAGRGRLSALALAVHQVRRCPPPLSSASLPFSLLSVARLACSPRAHAPSHAL
jgi:hypothetical protein